MSTGRLYFLDNLKWFIIWLMVVFHGAMCYMAYARTHWTYQLPYASRYLAVLCLYSGVAAGAYSFVYHGVLYRGLGLAAKVVRSWRLCARPRQVGDGLFAGLFPHVL